MAYIIQIACIAILAEVLLRVIPVGAAGFRYAYWRLVLAAALVMPWLLRRTPALLEPSAAESVAPIAPAAGLLDLPVATGFVESAATWPAVLPWILAAGVAGRLLWVGVGVARLKSLRRRGEPVTDAVYDEIQRLLGTSAELRAVPGISQPVTFGIRRPVVLLPRELATASGSIRRAAVTHELVHVSRRDWLWVIGEEALRALFWFHPAIWWLTSRIQLAREEFTDHLTVLATGNRRTYMEALLAFAEGVRLHPAPAFARRAHLFHRIVALSKESGMSSRRIVTSGVALAVLLAAGGWYSSEAFPLPAEPSRTLTTGASLPDFALRAAPVMDVARRSTPAPQVTRRATPPVRQSDAAAVQVNPITPENPIPRRVFSTPIPYPIELAGTGVTGTLQMRVVLNASGSVASVTRGEITVGGGNPPTLVEARQRALNSFTEAARDSIQRWQYEAPARAPIEFYVSVAFRPGAEATVGQSDRRSAVAVGARGGAASAAAAGIPRINETIRVIDPPPAAGAPVRVGGNVGAPTQIRRIDPVYPPIAKSARVQGIVILEALIDEQGNVDDARILRSIPLLDQAAIDAVRQWQYQPTLLNGAPTPVLLTVTVAFSLEQ